MPKTIHVSLDGRSGARVRELDFDLAALPVSSRSAKGLTVTKWAVKDVRASTRLTDSAVCLVADEGDLDMHLERLLKQHKQLSQSAKRILEVNPRHPLIARLADLAGTEGAASSLGDFAWLLLDQARIVEGEQLPDPPAFARRLALLLERGLPAA